MTLPEAATKYDRNAEYLRVAANRGTLKAKKVGRDWLVSDEAMVEFLARNVPRGRPKKTDK